MNIGTFLKITFITLGSISIISISHLSCALHHYHHPLCHLDKPNESLLLKAIFENDLKLAKEALDLGADIKTQDRFGFTALHYAALKGHTKAALFLIDNKAKINMQDKDGETPLHLAAILNHLDMVELFAKYGAKRDLRDKRGNTPDQILTSHDKEAFDPTFKKGQTGLVMVEN